MTSSIPTDLVPLPDGVIEGMQLAQQRMFPGKTLTYHRFTLGYTVGEAVWVDGVLQPVDTDLPSPSPSLVSQARPEFYRLTGLAWSAVTVTLTADGVFSWVIDWDGPPDIPLPHPIFGFFETPERIAGNAAKDLRLYPRPPQRVPVWMKAWLATQGGWDLETDQPRYDDHGFTGTPVPYEQAYQVLHARNPSVIPHALTSNLPTSSATTAGYTTTSSTGTSPDTGTGAPTGTSASSWPPPTGAPVATTPPWPTPEHVLDPAPYAALQTRWARLAATYPDVITLLPTPTPHQLNHLAPAARAAATALPGATIGDILTLTWHPSTPTSGQILHTDHDLIITAPLTHSGNLDHLTATTREDDDTPHPIPRTVLQYWTGLTHTAEQAAATLADLAAHETDDPDEQTLTHTELLADHLTNHLDALTHPGPAGRPND